MKPKLILGLMIVGIMFTSLASFSSAADLNATVCCERTLQGAFCQNVPSSQCDPNPLVRQVPTSCESTSYCKVGTCYDSSEGTCLDNTPQLVCNNNGGIWSETSPAQCQLGCCVLGDQASFVTLTRCKQMSSFLGLKTSYNPSITSEAACVASVQNQDKGACVYEFEFEKKCTFTTRAACASSTSLLNGTTAQGVFFKDKLCSAEELGTVCGPSEQTTCSPGKDGVYFTDTCGNIANIYDASKINDKEYWTNVKTKAQSCNPLSANANSAACGNCNYLGGSVCRDADAAGGRQPAFGDFICANLNCVDDSGKARKHGESWCLGDDARKREGVNSVGSRFFRQVCMNGEVVTEPCDDLRAEECVEDSITTSVGPFSQAACRVNRWQDCVAQTDQRDCENADRRDCFWKEGVNFGNSTVGGACLPENSPGLRFWESEESRIVCGAGNQKCVVQFEKGLFGGERCVGNCECLEPGWERKYGEVCSALGDCGSKVNIVGKIGFKDGIRVTIDGKNRTDA